MLKHGILEGEKSKHKAIWQIYIALKQERKSRLNMGRNIFPAEDQMQSNHAQPHIV